VSATVLAGASVAIIEAASTATSRFGLPFYHLYGMGSFLVGLALTTTCAARGELSRLSWRCWKWALLRGVFGTSVFLLTLMAVSFGASLGDVNALSCINIVMSALLGRAFLGEALRPLHGLALLMSVVGAVLISKPEFLFGNDSMNRAPLLGYATALGAGVASGGIFIAARRACDISPLVMTASVMVMEGATSFVLPLAGVVNELPLQSLFAAPLRSIVALVALMALTLFASGTITLGAQLCPAALSSTIFSATSMALGYAFEFLLHHHAPELLTTSGAALMLSAVALMAFARWLYHPAVEVSVSQTARDDVSQASEQSSVSLVSFVASEWSGVSLGAVRLRQRTNFATTASPVAHTVGFPFA
jgi:drug/metabolite transporter (DMT)-like permease